MKEIPLSQGQVALVDDADCEYLMQWKWCAAWAKNIQGFYAVRHQTVARGKRVTIYMHRQLLGLERGDRRQVDHENHKTLDNQRHNIRIVTTQQNAFNRKAIKGYARNKGEKKFHATIGVDGRLIHLGYHDTTEQAHQAYVGAKDKYHKIAS